MTRPKKILLVLTTILLISWVTTMMLAWRWVPFSSLPTSRTSVTSLGHGLSLQETYAVECLLYSGIAEAGQAFYWPIPSRVDIIQEQRLLRGERSLWVGNAQSDEPRRFFPSPNGATVLVEGEGYGKPWELVDTVTGRVIRVPPPEVGGPGGNGANADGGHYYVYPLVFRKWLPDSSGLLAEASGYLFRDGASVGYREYRELWRVDAATGRAARITHTENTKAVLHSSKD